MGEKDARIDRKKRASAKPAVTLPGTVERIIPSLDPAEPDKAQIAVEDAEPLYRELRIENTLKDASGDDVSLKPGAEVDVTIEADPKDTIPKDSPEKAPKPKP